MQSSTRSPRLRSTSRRGGPAVPARPAGRPLGPDAAKTVAIIRMDCQTRRVVRQTVRTTEHPKWRVALASSGSPSGGLPGHRSRTQKTTGWQYATSTVRKRYGERTFAGARGNERGCAVSRHSPGCASDHTSAGGARSRVISDKMSTNIRRDTATSTI